MSFPLTTRFGADPTRDLEVANKRYVDASGGGLNQFIMGLRSNDFAAANERNTWFGASWQGTDANMLLICNNMTLTNLTFRVSLNTNSIDGQSLNTRIDQTEANCSVTYDQATGEFQDLVNTDTILALEQIDMKILDGNGSGLIIGVTCQATWT